MDDSRTHRLLTEGIRHPLEQIVSEYYRYAWRINTFQNMNDFACHPAAILSDGTVSVFAKFSAAANGQDQFEVELAALDYFQPVPEDGFSAYREIQPIEPGFGERRLLWRVAGYLAAVAVEGEGYLNMLSNAVQSYL